MPYLTRAHRKMLPWCQSNLALPAELNYVFTETIAQYLQKNGASYAVYNEIIGALECCKLELYRRKIAPYEDIKIRENGDVY